MPPTGIQHPPAAELLVSALARGLIAVLALSCAPTDTVNRVMEADAGEQSPDADNGGTGGGGAGGGAGGSGGAGRDGPPRDGAADAASPDAGIDDRPSDPPAPTSDSSPLDQALDRPTDLPPDAPPLDAAPPDGPAEKVALFVVAMPAALGVPDMQIKSRLEGKGFRVIVADDASPASQAESATVLVVSSTASSAMVGATYTNLRVPAVILEAYIFDDMRMTGATVETDYGESMGTQVNIVLPGHPLAAGLTGTVTVTTMIASNGYGVPAATAERVATLGGMPTRFAVFGYPAGAAMVGGFVAPARRVGLFATSTTTERLGPMGWQLFDAAVDWALLP